MFLVLTFFFYFAYSQDYNCPPYGTTNCNLLKKSQKCENYYQFVWDWYTGWPLVLPVRCVDNPNTRNCMASPASPSTATSGLCRPRCVNPLKDGFYVTNSCASFTNPNSCARSVTNCGLLSNVKCDWCGFNNATGTCESTFFCNDGPF